MAKGDKQTAQQALVDDQASSQNELSGIGQFAQAGMLGAAMGAAAFAAIKASANNKVRAKMRVERIDPVPNGQAYIHLRPVTSGSAENTAFYDGMPGGAVTIGLVSKDVARMFVLNADYFVDFTPAD